MLASCPWHSIPWEVRSYAKSFLLQESIKILFTLILV